MPRPKLKPTEDQRRHGQDHDRHGSQAGGYRFADRCTLPKTLRKYFRNELDQGASEANMTVAQAMYKNAKDGNVKAGMFWLKCRAGWRERPDFDGPAAAPPPFIVAREKTREQPWLA